MKRFCSADYFFLLFLCFSCRHLFCVYKSSLCACFIWREADLLLRQCLHFLKLFQWIFNRVRLPKLQRRVAQQNLNGHIFLNFFSRSIGPHMILLAERTQDPSQDSYRFVHLVNASFYGPEVAPQVRTNIFPRRNFRSSPESKFVFIRICFLHVIQRKSSTIEKKKVLHAISTISSS